MIGALFKLISDRLFSPVNVLGARIGLSKIHINLLEIGIACVSGIAYALAWIPAGWALLIIHGFLDYFDGGTRRTGLRDMRDYRFLGMDTHILADKASEVVIFIGLAIGGIVPAWIVGIALASSLGVTIFGQILKRLWHVDLKRSIFDRAARIIAIVVLGLLVNYTIALLVVCGMNGIIFLQRIVEFTRVKKGL